MQIEIKTDATYTEPKVIILTPSVTSEINNIVQKLSECGTCIISGNKDGKTEILEQENLIRIYAADGRVFAVTDGAEYVLRRRLYELEESLDNSIFVRISNSEIINIKKVKSFDLSFTGTICVEFLNGSVTYVSRRYVSKIKKVLGL